MLDYGPAIGVMRGREGHVYSGPRKLHFTSVGFWLPCYRSSFYTDADDRALLRSAFHHGAAHFAPEYVGPVTSGFRLNATIFNRLLTVLPRKGYASAHLVPAGHAQSVFNEQHHDPSAMVFLAHETERLPGLQHMGIHALALTVNQDGFYVWTVAYDGKRREYEIQAALKDHIWALAGGSFSGHHSGIKSERRSGDQVPDSHLTQYRDEHIGFLTFDQINTIFEGLFNVNLDPRVFFRSDSQVEAQYTLGGFISEICAAFHPAKRPPRRTNTPGQALRSDENLEQEGDQEREQREKRQAVVAEFFAACMQHPTSVPVRSIHAFAEVSVYPPAKAHLLDEFLEATEISTLKPIKERVERCRRALLDELIEVTHRRDPLVQVEPPDGPVDRIDDVTEAQLRGYVMLLAAKLPLVANVRFHLDDLHYERSTKKQKSNAVDMGAQDAAVDDPLAENSQVYGPYHSWTGLLRAIQADLSSLTQAIDQARTDRMLYEQEQIYEEQETFTEIQRLNERADNAISAGNGLAINGISTFLALVAVVLASGNLFKNGKLVVSANSMLGLLNLANLPGLLVLVVAVAILVVVFTLIYLGVNLVLRWVSRAFRQEFRLDEKFYYEMDVRVDAPFLIEALPALITHGEPESKLSGKPLPGFWTRVWKQTEPFRRWITRKPPLDATSIERNSYRVERLEKSEALHKIYVEARLRLGSRRHLRVVLVYELLYHRPARDHDYILRELRVVSAHSRQLTHGQVARLKQIVVERFLNPCLEDGWQLKRPGQPDTGDKFDALFTVTELPANQQARDKAASPEDRPLSTNGAQVAPPDSSLAPVTVETRGDGVSGSR